MKEDGQLSQQPFVLVLVWWRNPGAVETSAFACGPFFLSCPNIFTASVKTKSQDATEGAFPESIWTPIGENLYTAGWLQLTPFIRAMLLRRSYFVEGWARLLNSHRASLASGSCQAHLREEQRKKRLRFVLLVAQCQASGATWWKNVVCAFLVF